MANLPIHLPRWHSQRWILHVGLLLAVWGLVLVRAGSAAEGGVYRFTIPTVEADPGDRVRITIRGEHAESAQGFSMSLRYPSEYLTIERIHFEDTILEAIGADYLEPKVSADQGTIVIGVLVDSLPPFTGALIPTLEDIPLDFIHIEAKVSAEAEGDLHLVFEDGLSVPPIDNLYSIDNQSVRVTELGEGIVHVKSSQSTQPMFVRGDFNVDAEVDISDPVAVLNYIFQGGAPGKCILAGDANDDDRLDVSDAIFVLNFLFGRGYPPPPPSEEPGPDPTPGSLSCVVSLDPFAR